MPKFLEPFFAAIFLAAVPYSIGFFYLSGYYSHFGVSISELAISQQEFFVVSVAATREILTNPELGSGLNSTFATFIFILLLAMVVIYGLRVKVDRIIGVVVLVVVSLVTAGFLLFSASKAGIQVAKRNIVAMPFVMVIDSTLMKSPIIEFDKIQYLQKLNVRNDQLLYADKDTIFLLRRSQKSNSFSIIRVPRNEETMTVTFDYWR